MNHRLPVIAETVARWLQRATDRVAHGMADA